MKKCINLLWNLEPTVSKMLKRNYFINSHCSWNKGMDCTCTKTKTRPSYLLKTSHCAKRSFLMLGAFQSWANDNTLYVVQDKGNEKKYLFSRRIELAKGYQIEWQMFITLDLNSYHCFPMKPEAWSPKFLHSPDPSLGPRTVRAGRTEHCVWYDEFHKRSKVHFG